MSATGSFTGGTSPAVAVTTGTEGGSGVTDGSDVLAGFLLYPVTVQRPNGTVATSVQGALLDTGRINAAKLPVSLSAAQKATSNAFVWA